MVFVVAMVVFADDGAPGAARTAAVDDASGSTAPVLVGLIQRALFNGSGISAYPSMP
ncbi:MAG TPA: hypothetical protein VNQ56_17930 [Pseudolabrys sp.]|nr:hypothetical protein [Pseudolabrys sp.]